MSNLMWAEKWRPRSFEDMVGQELIIKVLRGYIKRGDMPHLIFAGPPGCGKSTAAWCLAYEKFGEYANALTLELNASDERGIKTIKGPVKQFMRFRAGPKTDFRILILDEADHLTPDAQAALRRQMERFAKYTRIIFIVNNEDKIIRPIRSRCAPLKFPPLEPYKVWEYLKKILKGEGVNTNLTVDFVEKLYREKRGDLREIINLLQVMIEAGMLLSPESVDDFLAKPQEEEVKKVLIMALNGDFQGAWKEVSENVYRRGWTARQTLEVISHNLFDFIPELELQIEVAKALGACERSIWAGTSDEIQLQSFLAHLSSLNLNRRSE